MHGCSLTGNREIPLLAEVLRNGGPHREGQRAEACDERRREVRSHHSSYEACERTPPKGQGAGGAKGGGQGKRERSTRGPGTGPGSLVIGDRSRTGSCTREEKGERFTTLLHHIDAALLRQSDHWLKRDAVPGVDGMTWDAYGDGLEARLRALESRIHLGSYRAQPSLRAYIPKPDGRQRPLGIAALEDKIVQRAVVEVLNAIYEQDFVGFSYGFRPGRGQHDALDALAVGIGDRAVNWILDADIKGFFDNISHEWMMRFVEHRVAIGACCASFADG